MPSIPHFSLRIVHLLLPLLLLQTGIRVTAAATFHVAPTGLDSNAGTEAAPWRTIQKAANTLAPGDTVLIRGGTYNETVTINVSGSAAGGPVVFRNYPGEFPIIDGTGLIVPAGDTGLILVIDKAHLIIEGLELRSYITATKNRVPVGINLRGTSHHVELRKNRIHHIETNYAGSSGGDAHGIAVYGTSATASIHHLVIEGNELHNLKLGSSEALVLNGNVELFEVTKNSVHDCNNIGIDLIGFEGTASNSAVDQARSGSVRENVVFNIDSYGNPAYGNERSAGGIYVDGGRDIVIERNVVHHCNIGIELASEHAGTATRAIILRDNFVYLNQIGGIFIGGYDTQRGRTEDCLIINNTLFQNDSLKDGNGEFYMQFDTRNNIFKHNILYANTQNTFVTNPFTQNTGNVVDWNLYYGAAGAGDSEWQWKKTYKTGFAAYKAFSGNDANSLFVNPGLVDTALPDLHLKIDSPAADAGDPAFVPAAGETDIDDGVRLTGARVDIGADELKAVSAWRRQKFGPNAAQESIAGPDADPDADGLRNLLEFILGYEPLIPSAMPPNWVQPEDGYLTATISRNPAAAEARLTAESNVGLIAGTWSTATTTTLLDTASLFKARDNFPITGSTQRFLRLQATLP